MKFNTEFLHDDLALSADFSAKRGWPATAGRQNSRWGSVAEQEVVIVSLSIEWLRRFLADAPVDQDDADVEPGSHAVRRILKDEKYKGKFAKRFTPHDLRRTAATLAQSRRVLRDYVKALLNHSDGDVTAIYARWHMFPEKREAVMAIEAAVLSLMAAPAAPPPLNGEAPQLASIAAD
jgi:integrase